MLHLVLVAALGFAPSVTAIQDWWCDAIRTGGRALGFPRAVNDRLCAAVETGIADGAASVKQGYARLEDLAAGGEGEGLFDDIRSVIAIRDRTRVDAYGTLPPRNRLRALGYVEREARKRRGDKPAGLEAALAYLQKNGGAPLRQLLGVDTRRSDRLDVHLKQFAADRRDLRARREALFKRIDRAVKANAADATVDALLSDWQELEDETTHLDRAQIATVQEELTLDEKRHAARQLLPMIDRAMRWAEVYFKVRRVFTGSSGR